MPQVMLIVVDVRVGDEDEDNYEKFLLINYRCVEELLSISFAKCSLMEN